VKSENTKPYATSTTGGPAAVSYPTGIFLNNVADIAFATGRNNLYEVGVTEPTGGASFLLNDGLDGLGTVTPAMSGVTTFSGYPVAKLVGDLNGDGSSNNDLIYVPRTQSEISLVPSARPTGIVDSRTPDQIWKDLDAFISNDPYLSTRRGQYAERNGARTPWNHSVDLRLSQDIRFPGAKNDHNLQLTLDVVNFGNLLNKNWGKYYFVPNLNNQNVYLMAYRAGRAVGGIPTFSFDPLPSTPYQIDDLQSRWQMQLGLRYSF